MELLREYAQEVYDKRRRIGKSYNSFTCRETRLVKYPVASERFVLVVFPEAHHSFEISGTAVSTRPIIFFSR